MFVGDRNYKTVFILGAGATRGAVKHVLVNRRRVKPPLNADFFKVAETYARAIGATSATAQRLAGLKAVFKNEIPFKGMPTMEQAFSLLYTAKDFPEIYRTGPGKKPEAGDRKEIRDFLDLTFSILASLDQGATCPTAYDRLVGKLGSGDTVISLNYDTLLDSALVRAGWDPRVGYRLVGGKAKIEWTPASEDTGRLSTVSLLKLHGSVNWFVRGSYSNLAKIFDSKPVRVTAPRINDISGHIRQIVPPIYGKLFGHTHWRKIWKDAYKALCDAEVLVVMGCSLVDTDFHLRALIGRVAKHRKQNGQRYKKLIAVADVKTRRKWLGALKATYQTKEGYKSFEAFLQGGLKA
jgi:hypothetical protein